MRLGPVASRVATSAESPIKQLVLRLASDEVRSPYAKLLIARLAGATLKVAQQAARTLAERILVITGDFFKVSKFVAYRADGYSHLFGKGLTKARESTVRAKYFNVVDDVPELLASKDGLQALESRPVRQAVEQLRNQLSENVGAGIFESYRDLKRETLALNKINYLLHPAESRVFMRFDAHHLVETRMYDKFADEWKLIGWKSKDDMMAAAVPTESHIRSSASKTSLPGFEDRPDALISLTQRLQDEIKIDKYKNAEDLIDAYIQFYRKPVKYEGEPILGGEITNRVVEGLTALKRELRSAKAKNVDLSKLKALETSTPK